MDSFLLISALFEIEVDAYNLLRFAYELHQVYNKF